MATHNGSTPAVVEIDDMEWIDVKEASELSGFHPEHVRRLMRQGKIKGRKRGVWWINRDSLEAYLKLVEELGSKRFDPRGIIEEQQD